MAYNNIKFVKPNMEFVDGYFYTMDETYDALFQKVDDGSTAFNYPLQNLQTAVVNSIQYDGANLWTIQDSGDGFSIKRWRIENNAVELKDSFTYTDTASTNYDADTFAIENYRTQFTCTISGGDTVICPQEYYDSVITSGIVLTLGPNRYYEREEVTVSGVSGSNVTLTSGTQYSYESGDPISMYRSFFVFNNYDGLDPSNGSLMRFDAYTGSFIAADVRSEYKNTTACTFARVTNLLRNHNDVNTLIFVKDTQARFRNMSDLTEFLQASSVDDHFIGPNGASPNTTRWAITYGDPIIYDNTLRCSTTIDGHDEIESNYEILGDFSVQISGSLKGGFSPINTDRSYFYHTMGLSIGSNEYAIGTSYQVLDLTTSGLVREYTMDSVSGTVLYDTSGNYSNASMGGIVISPGKVGNAAEINADSDYIKIDSAVGDSVVSISMWYYYGGVGAGTWNTLVGRDAGTYHHLIINDASRQIGFYNGAWYSSGYALTLGQWYHIVLIKNGTNSKLYINKTLRQHSNSSFNNSSYPIAIIGNYSSTIGTQGAIGKIDQVRIYNKDLSTDEILDLYDEGTYGNTLNELYLYTTENGIQSNTAVLSGTDYFFKLIRSDNVLDYYYKNVVSGIVDQSWSHLDSFISTNRNCNISLGLVSAGLTVSGSYFDDLEYQYGIVRYPPPTTPYYDIMVMDNIRINQSTIIPITDISYSNGNLYRLQDEGTYYGTNNDWGSQYNYVCSPVRSFIDAITIEAYPIILPANGRNVAAVNCVVLDQFANGALNAPIFFTDNDDYGYVTINPQYTDYIYGTGAATTYYRSGVDVHTVTIQGTVTQYD